MDKPALIATIQSKLRELAMLDVQLFNDPGAPERVKAMMPQWSQVMGDWVRRLDPEAMQSWSGERLEANLAELNEGLRIARENLQILERQKREKAQPEQL